jgi:leucyl-tRNA synthetase
VPQRRLLDVLTKHVPGDGMTRLLEAVIVTPQGRGVPQGGCLSPLLLNVYLHHHLDRVWLRRHPGKPLVRVADDLLVLCSSWQEAAGARAALESLRRGCERVAAEDRRCDSGRRAMGDDYFYCVVMFPYPSGAGLHLGHCYNYGVVDSYCRWLRYKGQEVYQPFGYDAFGLPAENYARSIGGDPRQVTCANIERFRAQMARMNTQYQERLVTCDPGYVRWTQWVFSRLLQRGLAYKARGEVNYCRSCETVLANEQVKEGRCDRCATEVAPAEMEQRYFKITAYRDRLIRNLDRIDYPEGTRKMQRSWLENLRDWCVSRQRKWGCPIPVEGETDTLDTFVDSSFYYLRYLTDSDTEFLPAGQYKQVDLYVGGSEHACMHLIYARFIHMFLHDIGVVPEEEPFRKVIHQGMITKGGAKMGKSKGNAVNPDDYDPDEMRMFLMFLGPYQDGGDWDDRGVAGIRRFLKRMRRWLAAGGGEDLDCGTLEADIDHYMSTWKVNKVVSAFMEFYNENKGRQVSRGSSEWIGRMLRCFAPSFTAGVRPGE